MDSGRDRGMADSDPSRIQQWDDQQQAWLREAIRLHGWAVQSVAANPARRQPPFAYTIGLTRYGHAELVVFGLDDHDARTVLDRLGHRARSGVQIADGAVFAPDVAGPRALRIVQHPFPAEVLFVAVRRYGPRVTAMQILVADERGTFPGEAGFLDEEWRQPRPGMFAA